MIAPHGYAYLYNTPETYVRRPCSMVDLTLMLVSRSIWADAKEILHEQTVFVIELDLCKRPYGRPPFSITDKVSRWTLEQIRRLALILTVDVHSAPRIHLQAFQSMSSLRDTQLTIRVHQVFRHKASPCELARLLLPIQVLAECMPSSACIRIGTSTDQLMHGLLRSHSLAKNDYGTSNTYSERVTSVAQRHLDRLTVLQGALSRGEEMPGCVQEDKSLPPSMQDSERHPHLTVVHTFGQSLDIAVGVPAHLLIYICRVIVGCIKLPGHVFWWSVGSPGETMIMIVAIILVGAMALGEK